MLRNKDGINFDEGIPLINSSEFENLYVQSHQEEFSDFLTWIKNQITPLLIGGQIGSGKSTFINKAFNDLQVYPDFVFHFDQDVDNIFDDNPLLVILKEIVSKAISAKIDLSFSNAPSELTKGTIGTWEELINLISAKDYSLDAYYRKKEVAIEFQTHHDFILPILKEIMDLYENKINRKSILFASGIDKYLSTNLGTFFLHNISDFLSTFKTLFEVNAVHIFDNKWALKSCQKIFLTTLNKEQIHDLFKKRMGVYISSITNVVDGLTSLSGGNPRQALRLLTNYVNSKTFGKTDSMLLFETVRKTSQDYFSFATRPSADLMKHIYKEKSLSATTFSLAFDKDTAQRALYENWIFVNGRLKGDQWAVQINPLISYLFLDSYEIKDYETQLLSLYANNQQISDYGLTIVDNSDLDTSKEVKTNSLVQMKELLGNAVLDNYVFNSAELLEMISTALLSKDRPDRIIISYRDKDIINPLRYYIFAKANTYDYQSFVHVELTRNNISPLGQILDTINKNHVNIFSFDFKDEFDDKSIEAIDKIRDILLSYQIIWWIPFESLKKYLPRWSQLRQLFQIFVLEDELLASIDINEVENDLKYYSQFKSKSNARISEVMSNLEKILLWMKKSKENINE
ncbi:MAG: hypothetical protein ACYDEE_16825 [Ignavibacteriaceae bacterium]